MTDYLHRPVWGCIVSHLPLRRHTTPSMHNNCVRACTHNFGAGAACVLFLCSCASGLDSRVAYDGAGAATGAFIGHEVSDGDPTATIIGATSGVVVSEVLQNISEDGRRRAYAGGYDRGRSDAAKDQYWVLQNQHKRKSEVPPAKVSLYEIPAHPREGIHQVPHNTVIRIEE